MDLDPNRKIGAQKSSYLVKVKTSINLETSFSEYANNFYRAAHEIAFSILKADNSDFSKLDTYFFSLAFLYRHSLELLLKAIAFQHIKDKAERVDFVKDTFHDLAQILERILQLNDTARPKNEIGWLTTYFRDFSKYDKESDSFRYPFHIKRYKKKSGDTKYSIERIFNEQTHIDLLKFAKKFESAYEILSLWFNGEEQSAIKWILLKPVFIETGGDYYTQAVVGRGYLKREFYPYVRAYTETAEYLRYSMTEAQDKGNTALAEIYFFPMCYLYRNAVELTIKATWFEEVREDFQERCKILNKKKHSINGLWYKLRGWIEDFYEDGDGAKEYFDDIGKCCEEIQGFDSDASKFRYPCDKSMNNYFKKDIKFDYMNIAELMESLIQSINGIDSELSFRNEYLDEAETEFWR